MTPERRRFQAEYDFGNKDLLYSVSRCTAFELRGRLL